MEQSLKRKTLSGISLLRPLPRGKRIAYVTTYPPRECGIATFTYDLSQAINTLGVFARPTIIAINDSRLNLGKSYSKEVRFIIEQHDKASYLAAAEYINNSDIALVSLQHEFGIYGTESGKDNWDGSMVLDFLRALKKPVVTTMHTVLKKPNEFQLKAIQEIAQRSDRIVLMARNSRRILEPVYNIPREKMAFIHHGAPDVPFHGSDYFKRVFGLEGREVLMSFGFLSPGKGIEYVLNALPDVVKKHPEVMYLIVGATHPVVRKEAGERYRRELQKIVKKNKLIDNVKFVNQYLTLNQLILFLRATNIYLAPQLNPEQYVSGTVAYAAAFGKAIVSTKFRYARSLLRKGRGILVPFGDSVAIAGALNEILDNPQKKRDLEEAIYIYSRKMTWQHVASRYADLFRRVLTEHGVEPEEKDTLGGHGQVTV
jgi:glycosyltransferase involved in cell wall biosynthesis